MRAMLRRLFAAALRTRGRRAVFFALLLLALAVGVHVTRLALWTLPLVHGRLNHVLNPAAADGMVYFHDSVPEVPWSMHVVKVSRQARDLEFHTTLGGGDHLGMAIVSEQVRRVPAAWGRPVAAVNGDLYNSDPMYHGDPEGLQIRDGELVSGPSATRVCLWLGTNGAPQHGEVVASFAVLWPDGRSLPFGLNEGRLDPSAVLYTAAVGTTTRAYGGREIVLEAPSEAPWLPLRIGREIAARVRSVNHEGNTPLAANTMVLSLSPTLASQWPAPAVGTVLRISTSTSPSLQGVRTAIGGGPTLVAGGKPRAWSGLRLRHPRTAIGWNADFVFLVVVDGRQLGLSAGMTFPELADYMAKLGCQEAIGLDGGGSATCWANGSVKNSPSQGRERPAANALVVVRRPPKTSPAKGE